jgi:hypothetical protein
MGSWPAYQDLPHEQHGGIYCDLRNARICVLGGGSPYIRPDHFQRLFWMVSARLMTSHANRVDSSHITPAGALM